MNALLQKTSKSEVTTLTSKVLLLVFNFELRLRYSKSRSKMQKTLNFKLFRKHKSNFKLKKGFFYFFNSLYNKKINKLM